MEWPPLALRGEDRKTSTRYIELLSRTIRPFTVMNVKSYVITIDEDSIPNNTFVDIATPVPTNAHLITKKTNLDPPARTIVSHNIDTDCKEPREYIVDKVIDHHHTIEDLIYKI